MAAQNFTEFNLPKDAYAAFDAVSLKSLIIKRLQDSKVFSDQVYEGSNLSAIIDIIAYSYHVTLFYLNHQAAESYFSQATLYENLNKLVNLIGYNPLGSQTSIVSFEAIAQAGLPSGNYVIPRYSFVVANGVFYSTPNDIYFEKTNSDIELLNSIGDQNLLYQGQFREYPSQTAIGQEFETLTIAVDSIVTTDNNFIDFSNIFVYVKDATTQIWSEWQKVATLFNSNSNAKVFEKRLNDAGRYELKFGDNITGKKLNANDQIAIYYLQSAGSQGVISANTISDRSFVRFVTPRFREIISQIYNATDSIATQDELNAVWITNTNRSTDPKTLETVEEIRQNTPKVFSTQNRAVTVADYDILLQRNFSNLVKDARVLSNTQYINSYVKYFYDIKVSQPNNDSRVLLNQLTFADSCDFNNIYAFVVPRNFIVNNNVPLPLSPNLKQLIVSEMENVKMQNVEIIPSDPVYIAIDIATAAPNEVPQADFRKSTQLIVKRSTNSKISSNQIKTNVTNIILDFFDVSKISLGQTLDFFTLTKNVLATPGVDSITTSRQLTNGSTIEVIGFSFVLWNPQYDKEDVSITTQNVSMPIFKYPFLIDRDQLFSKIKVI